MKNVLSHALKLTPFCIQVPMNVIRRSRHWRNAGIIYIHVPKTAGVSISHAIYGKNLGHFRAQDVQKWAPDLWNSSFTFGSVRNPIERFISAYNFMNSRGTNEMGLSNQRKYPIKNYSNINDFVSEWFVSQDLSRLDGIFRLQSDYLTIGEVIVVDFLLKVETLDEDMRRIGAMLGEDFVMNTRNVNTNSLDKNLSKHSKKILFQKYYYDFLNFGYSIEDVR